MLIRLLQAGGIFNGKFDPFDAKMDGWSESVMRV